MRKAALISIALLLAASCAPQADPCLETVCEHPARGGGGRLGKGDAVATSWTNWQRDILSTALTVDLAAKRATARVQLAAAASGGASFDVSGLAIGSVEDAGGPLRYEVVDGRLDVDVPAGAVGELTISYGFAEQQSGNGLSPGGETLTWPYFCGNLFPCKPDPDDGLRFELTLENVPAGERAVYPAQIPADAPSYMLAWVTGDYAFKSFGTTAAGTAVGVWWRPGEESRALAGTDGLLEAFGWLEREIGPYTFGPEVSTVSVRWGSGSAYGGMEHHPYWHVSHLSIDDFYVHAHEAAHGWFGDGVRIRCWEDFVLSEGTVSYLAARAIAAVKGPAAAHEIWQRFRRRLERAVASPSYGDGIAWPATSCNAVDLIEDNLFTSVPYMKGAFFYRAVEQAIGVETTTRAIARFYRENVGHAAGMQQMIDTIKAEVRESVGGDASAMEATIDALARDWLRSSELPELPALPPAP